MYDIIMKKRNGGELSKEEIHFFIEGYTRGEIPVKIKKVAMGEKVCYCDFVAALVR